MNLTTDEAWKCIGEGKMIKVRINSGSTLYYKQNKTTIGGILHSDSILGPWSTATGYPLNSIESIEKCVHRVISIGEAWSALTKGKIIGVVQGERILRYYKKMTGFFGLIMTCDSLDKPWKTATGIDVANIGYIVMENDQ